jgi:hypothetical protein
VVTPISGSLDDLAHTGRQHAANRSTVSTETSIVLVWMVLAGIGASTASGHPTGLHPLDLALPVLLAIGCVAAGRLTPWPFVAGAAALAAAMSYGSPAALVAVGVLGISLAAWRAAYLTGRMTSEASVEPRAAVSRAWEVIIRSACCGALVDVGLRGVWPHVALVPSLLAGLVVLLICVPAVVVAPRGIRRVVIRIVGLVLLAALLLSAIAAFELVQARSPISSGLAAAKQGLKAAEHGQQAAAIADFKTARNDFATANSDLNWARAAETVPVVSQQVRAVRTAASIGTSLSAAGVATAATASVQDLKLVHGVFPVARLAGLVPVFRQDVAVLTSVNGQTGPFSSPWVIGALRSKFRTERARLQQAQHDASIALLAAEEVPGILGANGERHYLLLVEQPSEMRGSGGVIGDYAEVTADAGRLHLGKVGSVAQLNTEGVPPLKRQLPPPSYVVQRSGASYPHPITDFIDRYDAFFPQDHWENISMSPDFPTVGAVASYLFPQSGGQPVDGVISIDPIAMAGLLKMIGPVNAPGIHQKITASNVDEFLAHGEFIEFPNNTKRVAFVKALLKVVWHDLVSHSLPEPQYVAKDMQPAIRGGHLLMYSNIAADEQLFTDMHVAGGMPPVTGDFLGVVTQNAVGNKIDWYLRRRVAYGATVNRKEGTISSTLSISLSNSAPTSGEPPYVIDPVAGIGTKPGEDQLWVSVYTPWLLTTATLNGKPIQMTSQYELGRSVYSALVKVPSHTTEQIVVNLSGQWRSSQPYSLGWYHQPVEFPDVVSSHVTIVG